MRKLTVLFLGLLAAATLSAAPFAQWFNFPGAGGKTYRIYGEGDEFTAWFEAEDGHAVGFNEAQKAYEYLRPQADGSLVGTGILVGGEAGHEAELAAIPLHARDTSAAHDEEVRTRIEEFDRANQVTERWEDLKAKTAVRNMAEDVVTIPGMFMSPPSWQTVETLVGAVILVDFPTDDGKSTLWQTKSPGITVADIDTWLNATDGTAKFGNACSARQYYRDVSNNKFDYSQVLLGPYTMPHPRSYYDDPSKSEVDCAKVLFADLASVSFSSEDRTKLSKASNRGVNIIFAGPEAANWSKGLWAHMATASYTFGGRTFRRYNISPLGYSPVLYGFCHENGHMMCDFPDFYSYSGLSHTMVGTACLMAARANDRNPSVVSAYLRMHAGWVTPKDLRNYNNSYVTIARSVDDVYKYPNPKNSEEYYLIENRGGGHDGSMCGGGKGILIWHCNEDGNNTNVKNRNAAFASETDGSQYRISNFELTLEQADGLYNMERNQNPGDANDLWHSGNTAAGYPGEFTDLTVPTAKWMDNTASGLVLGEFSSNGGTMTFAVGTPVVEGAPTIADQITAAGYVGTGKLTVSSFGTGASSADVFVDVYGEATRKTLIASIKVATGLASTSQKTYTFPLVADCTAQYVRFRVVNNLGKAAYGTLVEAANGKVGDSTGGWGTTGGNDLGAAVDAPSLTIAKTASDSGYCWWDVHSGQYRTAPSCARFYCSGSGNKEKTATLTATVAGPGTFSFFAACKFTTGTISSGNSAATIDFTVNGTSKANISCTKANSSLYWQKYSVELPSGSNTLKWNGSWSNKGKSSLDNAAIYIDQFALEKDVAAAMPVAKITTSSLQPDRATVSAQVTDKAGETSVTVSSIVVSPNSDYSGDVYTGAPGAVTGLQPLTRYYVQATLTGASGTTYPAIGSFVTPDWTRPTGSVTVSSVQHYSATVDVSVTNPGSENAADIVKTVTVARDSSFAEVLKNEAPVPCELTGLDAGTTYYVRGILTGPLTGDTYVETTFTTLSASYPLIGSVKSADVGTDTISVNVTVSSFGDGSSGGTVLVEAVAGGVVAASANGTASGVYALAGLDRDTSYTIRVTVTGSNGLVTVDESLVVKTLNVPVILADPKASVGEEGASATMSARVAFREATVTDSNVKLYLTKSGESETLAKTWNSYAQGDVLSFMADTEPNVDYTYRFVASTKWNSRDWTAEAAGEFRTEYYVTNDWLTVDFESYAADSPLPDSDAGGAWTKAVGGVYESSSTVANFASEFGKGKGLDQSGESTYAKYTATAMRPDGIRCLFDADMYFTVCKIPPESLTAEVLSTATTAIFLYSGEEANNFRVYTADGWTDVFAEGFEPASKTFHHVTIDVDYDVSPVRVRFTVDGHLLADANGVKWFDRANPSKTDRMTAVSVYGNTKLDGFSAKMLEYGNSACPHANKRMTSPGQDATCTEAGHTAAYYCPDCERVWASVEIPALGHAWGEWTTTKAATATETGMSRRECRRNGCNACEEREIPMLARVIALRNIAVVTAVGTAPTLPAKVAGLRADGTVEDEYEVSWSPVPAPDTEGITTVTGAAQVDGKAMSVTASVRAVAVSTGGSGELVNVAPLASSLVASTPGTTQWDKDLVDLSAITNGWGANMVVGGWNTPGNNWRIYTQANVDLAVNLDFTWSSPQKISKIFIATFDDNQPGTLVIKDGSTGHELEPSSHKIDQNDYYKINQGDGHLYVFDTPVTLSQLRVEAVKKTGGRWYGFYEIEVWAEEGGSGGTVEPLTTDTLTALEVDHVAVAGFAPDTLGYSVDNGEAITSAVNADDNVGITILPKCNGSAHVVTLAEDGVSTKTYTVAMPAAVPQATVKIVDRSGKEVSVTKPLDEIAAAINDAVASADYGSTFILPALDLDYTVTLAPGVRVVKNADSKGTVSLVIPSAKSGWYSLNAAGDAMELSDGAKPVVTDITMRDGVSVVAIGNVKADLYYAVVKSGTVFGFETASVVATSGKIASGETFVFELSHEEDEASAFYKIVVTDDPEKML